MKFKSFILFLIFSVVIAQAQVRTNGYLSFEYTKGQDQAEFSQGSFKDALLGLIFSGEITPKMDYAAEMRFKSEARVEIEQAWVRFKSSDSFSLQLGLYLVPFGRYNQSNRPHQTILIKDPLNLENVFPSSWRDIGILIKGKLSSFVYSAYIGNGLSEGEYLRAGQQFRDNNSDKGKGGRIGLTLSRELEIAFSYYRGKYDERNERNLVLQGVDLSWISEGFQILSEYSKASNENPEGFGEGKTEGYFVQLSFDIGGLRPVVSYQKLKYKDGFHGQGFSSSEDAGEGISEDRSRWALGVVYAASQNVFFKIEYDFNREKEIDIKDNTLTVQVALSF